MPMQDEPRRRHIVTREAIRSKIAARYPRLAARRNLPPPQPADPTAIAIGRNKDGLPVLIGEHIRMQHWHLVGASGGGKSNALEHICRQTIEDGRGLFLIDPHGHSPQSAFRHLLAWLEDTGRLKSRRVHVIDPNSRTHVTSIQPLMRPSPETDVSVVASNCYEAVEKVFGAGETAGKGVIVNPTIRRILMAEFAAAAELGLTFPELPLLLHPHDEHGVRAFVVEQLEDRYAKAVLAELHQMGMDDRSKRDFRAEVVGPLNRLSEFVRAPGIRNILGQTDPSHILDFGRVLAENDIVLMNAAGGERVSSGDAEVLARLALRTLFFHIERRREPFTPFFVAIDECHKVLTGDIERMLAEVRKQSVGFLLSHQTLSQLGKPDDPMRVAVQGNTNIKLVFRLRDSNEAAELAEAVVPLDLERPVAALVRPTVVGHRRTTFRSASVGQNDSTNWSEGTTETDSYAESVTESFSETVGRNSSHSVTDTAGTSTGWSRSMNEGASESASGGSSVGFSSSETQSLGTTTNQGASRGISVEVPATTRMGEAGGGIGKVKGQDVGGTGTLSEGRDASLGTSQGTALARGQSGSTSSGWGRGASRGVAVGESSGESASRAVGSTIGESVAVTRGTSVGHTVGKSFSTSFTTGETHGTSSSEGFTEGLEPIFEMLPSTVHSIENVRYMAAQVLRSLPTGQAFLNLVTTTGMQASHVFVPEIWSRDLSETEFAELRRRALAASPSAISSEQAALHIVEHERQLLAEAARPTVVEEPLSFRVPAPGKSRTRRKGSGRP